MPIDGTYSATRDQNVKAGRLITSPDTAPASTTSTTTLTAAQVLGGIVVNDPSGGSITMTLPTAALLDAALPEPRIGDVIRCLVVNGADAAETITIAAGTGGGFDANQTSASRVIGQNTSKTLHIRITGVGAAAAYVVYA